MRARRIQTGRGAVFKQIKKKNSILKRSSEVGQARLKVRQYNVNAFHLDGSTQ